MAVVTAPSVAVPANEVPLAAADATFLNNWITEFDNIETRTITLDASQQLIGTAGQSTFGDVAEINAFIANNQAYIASLDPNGFVAQKLGADLAAVDTAGTALANEEIAIKAGTGSHDNVQTDLTAMQQAVADLANLITQPAVTAPPPVVAPTEHNPILNEMVKTWIGETNTMEQAGADIANGGGDVLALVAQISTFEHQTTLAQHLLPPSLPLTQDLKAANVAASVLLDGITNHDTAEIGAAITSLNTAAADVAKLLSPPTAPAASTAACAPVEYHHQVVEMPHFGHLWG